ncbi:MAG: hypothetical protein IJU31_05610 [Synergistaceae bacterium]|nr:hypothetical protein [Synergistaceae bacterium]
MKKFYFLNFAYYTINKIFLAVIISDMENNDSYFVQIIIFFALCAALCAGVWYGLHTLQDYREEYDTIDNERDNFSTVMESLRAKNKTLESINKIDFSNVGKVVDPTEFSSKVIQLIDDNAVDLLSMSTDDKTITMKLKGNYYSVVHLFADWREMPFASRITSLRITRNSESPWDSIDADVTLEAWRE